MKNIDEAILHCEEVVSQCDNGKCANEHRQLAEWLRELKECRQVTDDYISRQAVIDEIEYELEMINSALDSITLDFNAREKLRQRKGEAREILNSIQQLPSAQSDLSGYSDRLWKAAYERGKAEAFADIIHCGECKYYHDSDGCFFSTATTGSKGFCHWAERKDGEMDEAD